MRLDLLIEEKLEYSRKQVKKALLNNKVVVNNRIIRDGSFNVEGRLHKVEVDGKKIVVPKHKYYQLNKPEGVITASKDKIQKTVVDLIIEDNTNLFSVGRLDKNTTGLILLTDDGKLGYYLTQKFFNVTKEYIVTVNRILTKELIELFEYGVIFDDGYKCKRAKLEIIDDYHAKIIISEGKRHQIKKMFLAVGYYVCKLHRTRIGTLELDENLKQGNYRKLNDDEIKKLYDIYKEE